MKCERESERAVRQEKLEAIVDGGAPIPLILSTHLSFMMKGTYSGRGNLQMPDSMLAAMCLPCAICLDVTWMSETC